MIYGFPDSTLRYAFYYLRFVDEMAEYCPKAVEAHALLECGYMRAKQMIVTWAVYGNLLTKE